MRLLVACLAVLVLASAGAHAQTPSPDAVALLPLDSDKALEIYGQPVASEIARALSAVQVDVVVVGPRMAVPERARLILDGTITAKGETITIAIRMRNPRDGTVLLSLTAAAQGVVNIDKAEADLSARVVLAVQDKLAALHKPDEHVHVAVVPPAPTVARPRPLLVSVMAPGSSSAAVEPLRAALIPTVEAWSRAHGREPVPTDPNRLTRAFAANTVAASGNDLAIALEVRDYSVESGMIPLGRARVHVRIADATSVLFDRVVVTDSVIGDKGITTDQLASRVAREVLDILRPHLRRLVSGWR